MDKSWMKLKNRFSEEYKQGVKKFLEVATEHVDLNGRVRCPCKRCVNCCFKQLGQVKADLFINGISEDYTQWVHHGEPFQFDNVSEIDNSRTQLTSEDQYGIMGNDVPEMLEDLCKASFIETNITSTSSGNDTHTFNEVDKVSRLISDAQCELFPGCKKYSKLSFLVKMLNNKIMTNSSNKSFNLNLELFKDALPNGETLPSSYYEVKKYMRDLGFGYINIDACPNNCILFRKDYQDIDQCPKCQAPRWKHNVGKQKKVPQKVARYFPLKPRLQRLFMTKDIAKDMRWHKEKRKNDDVLRHPADAKTWKQFNEDHPWFGQDPRNIYLALASDGFNPFGNMSTSYSMWPVVLMPYNLPPWRCMKEPFFFLTVLIPGPDSPGNKIDVYLEPLIEELKELWEVGVQTYDAYTSQTFQLHAALLWTINDFPAYGMLSGWSTKGKLACPICNRETCSIYLKNSKKQCYMGHRRFLDREHPWRKSKKFDGKPEYRDKPKDLSGDDILNQLNFIVNNDVEGNLTNKRKRKRSEQELNWTRRCTFFDLPYWKTIKLRHNLDVMHIEKNISENVLGTLMNIEGKTKDTRKTRIDLEVMGIKKELHLQRDGNNALMPHACYTLTKLEIKQLCEWLKSIKFPDAYASNISRCVTADNTKVSGMKSHDHHIFIQRLLPAVAHGFLGKDVYVVLAELSDFFRGLCAKTVNKSVVEKLKSDISIILCKLEMIYPPSFFVIMTHLAIHLPHEVEYGGPVQFRWMYSMERFLHTLKDYVRNKARPEGSIAEAYIAKECLDFCSRYLSGVETRFNRLERNYDGPEINASKGFSIFTQRARPLGAPTYDTLSSSEFTKIQWYILTNCEEMEDYFKMHKEEILKQNPDSMEQSSMENFSSWFKQYVSKLHVNGLVDKTNHLYVLGLGPDVRIARYNGVIINGVRFHTIERDKNRRTQNSGVITKGEHNSEDIDFYGVLTDIIEMQYCYDCRVFVFKCDWWDVGDKRNGIRSDGYITSVNIARKWYTHDPYILASQAEQSFYINDIKNGENWRVVHKVSPRHIYNVLEKETDEDIDPIYDHEPYQQNETIDVIYVDQIDEQNTEPLNRVDVCPDMVPLDSINVVSTLDQNEEIIDDEEDDTLAEYDDDLIDIEHENDTSDDGSDEEEDL